MYDPNDTYKTSYQRAHYYQDIEDHLNKKKLQVKSNARPDLFFYDPIINAKTTIYKKHYSGKKVFKKPFESYGRTYFATKFSHKNLYNDFIARPVGVLRHDATTSGTEYANPMEKDDAKLLELLNPENFTNEKDENCIKNYKEYVHPYISTSKFYYQDFTDSMLNGIAKNDYITNRTRIKNTSPVTDNTCIPKPKSFFKVPYYGDSSLYKDSYKNHQVKNAFINKVCKHPEYFDTLKNDVSVIPKMYSTEQMQIGKGNKIIV